MNKTEKLMTIAANHIPGMNCGCSAYSEFECGCPDTDWRSRKEVAATLAVEYGVKELRKKHPKPEVIARDMLRILHAGDYHFRM